MESKIVNLTDIPYLGGFNRLSEAEATMLIDTYISNLKKSPINDPPHNNILGFLGLVQNAIRSRQVAESVPEGKRLLVLANDPPEEIDSEAITFYLNSRQPGQWSRGHAGQAGVIREVTGHMRSVQQHPEHMGEKLVTIGKRFDNHVTFGIYARDDYTALKRLLWFEDIMESYRWYFRVHGIYQIVEQKVEKKERITIGELPITRYNVEYFVMTEDFYQFGSQELKYVELNVNLATDN